jgi:hypothetical protein
MQIFEAAREQWRRQADASRDEYEAFAHDQMVEGLIDITELVAAGDAIFGYLHPRDPLRRVLDLASTHVRISCAAQKPRGSTRVFTWSSTSGRRYAQARVPRGMRCHLVEDSSGRRGG